MEANNDEVICPNCVTQFRAIPINVQYQLRVLEQLTSGDVEMPEAAPQPPQNRSEAMKPEKEQDYRRAIKKLQSQGFTVDNLLRYLNKIKEEVENKTQT